MNAVSENYRRSFMKTGLAGLGMALIFPEVLLGCKSNQIMVSEINENGKAFKLLRGSVGYFTERGGTIGWSISKKGTVVVDTQFPEQAGHLIEEIKKYKSQPIDLLINTHHHGDHTAGNIAFKDFVSRHISHENAKKNLIETATKANNLDKQLIPGETFSNVTKLVAGDEHITMHYFGRGHTNGDAITHFEKANVIHMGDLVFNRRFPYIDTSAGANIESWISVLDKTVNTFDKDTIYIFGHSGDGYDITGTAEDINAFKNYLEQLLAFGKKSLASGIDLETLKKQTTEIPGAPEWKGDGIARSLDAVYKELSKE
ncbi:MAG: MBL fold metallo-hydrolase [Saprospiraceae bacterium]|nr:MBL fold metallo-hydrolase [Saprospiraceae bacterium]